MSNFNAFNITRSNQEWRNEEVRLQLESQLKEMRRIEMDFYQRSNKIIADLEEKEKQLDAKILDVRGVIEDVMTLIKEYG